MWEKMWKMYSGLERILFFKKLYKPNFVLGFSEFQFYFTNILLTM